MVWPESQGPEMGDRPRPTQSKGQTQAGQVATSTSADQLGA